MFKVSFLYVALFASSSLAVPAPQAPTTSGSSSTVDVSSSASASSAASSVTSEVTSIASTVASTSAATETTATVGFISTEPNEDLWTPSDTDANPQPVRGNLGAPIIGPDNLPLDLQNPDLLAGPTTDHGSVQNAKWPFALSHNRLHTGGWARQQNAGVMPIATEMASVNMRLKPFAIRELHWHKTAEWAYQLKGRTQVTGIDTEGRNFVGTVGPGDLWFFPAGIPHSLQATDDDPDGSEFVLVFDSGSFSEDSTFLLTDWLEHVPYEVIEKNFQANNSEAFAHIPEEELFIFPGLPVQPDDQAPVSPQGTVPDPYTFALSQVEPITFPGGTVRIVDSSTFAVSKAIAAAEVTVEPGALRELHWHPTVDEWSFFLEGEARITIFAAQSNSRTFTYQAGDIGYVPTAMGHYVENIGNTTLRFLEIFNSDHFEDISLSQWLALTPPDLVKAHLDLSDDVLANLYNNFKTKQIVVGGGGA